MSCQINFTLPVASIKIGFNYPGRIFGEYYFEDNTSLPLEFSGGYFWFGVTGNPINGKITSVIIPSFATSSGSVLKIDNIAVSYRLP